MNGAWALIALSVLMHIAWNLLARHVEARCSFLWWGLLAHLVLLGPWALWCLLSEALWSERLVLATLISALANTLYFLTLRKAYHHAPVALVYPLARSAPLLIALWAWLIFGRELSTAAVSGIAVSAVGLWVLAASSRDGAHAAALPWALGAAFATSIYSLSDKAAVDHLPSFGAQLGFISVGYTAAFIGLSLSQYRESGSAIPACRPRLRFLLPGGLFIGTAYALVVRAMLELPAAYVVAYTNAGIILATLLSIGLLGERGHWKSRLLGAAVISIGLLVLGLSH